MRWLLWLVLWRRLGVGGSGCGLCRCGCGWSLVVLSFNIEFGVVVECEGSGGEVAAGVVEVDCVEPVRIVDAVDCVGVACDGDLVAGVGLVCWDSDVFAVSHGCVFLGVVGGCFWVWGTRGTHSAVFFVCARARGKLPRGVSPVSPWVFD